VPAIGPTWSQDQDSGHTPVAGTRPQVGLSPTTPQQAAGIRIDPAVSLPTAPGTSPAATAAADPPLDPPAIRPRSQGLAVPGVTTP
jgi:hypothetical protein